MAEPAATERLFLAVELPEAVKRKLGAVRARYPELDRELRWARPEGLHVTLKFLGETAAERQRVLQERLATLPPLRPFSLRCEAVGTFGSPRQPRVLWAGVSGDLAALGRLQERVEAVCVDLGWAAESRRYSPHVTLARGRGPLSASALSDLENLLSRHGTARFGLFDVAGAVLYRSRLGPGGSVYEAVACVPAPGSGPSL